MQLSRGEQIELTVDSLAYGGNGVGRSDGLVVFVSGAMPGDRVLAEVTKAKRSYIEASLVELLSPGPARVEPSCLHGGELCPGAPWQVLSYQSQLSWKEQQVTEALTRIGGFEKPNIEPAIGASEKWRYRNKFEYSFGSNDSDQLALGFHRRGRWWQVVDIEDCQLGSSGSNRARNLIRTWASEAGLEPYDRKQEQGILRNLVVREARANDTLQLRLVTTEGEQFDHSGLQQVVAEQLPKVTSLLWTASDSSAEALSGRSELLAGSGWLEDSLHGLRFRLSAEAFFQTNPLMAESLFETALEFAEPKPSDRLFDLYCGIGTVGLIFAKHCREVFGVDIVEEAIRDAITNSELNQITNASFFAGNIRTAVRPLIEKVGGAEIVVVDPPRSGLSQKVVRRLLEIDANKIIYISCNPTTMAPNLRQIVDGGYKLERVRPVDMFPQTPHIECVALLIKQVGSGNML